MGHSQANQGTVAGGAPAGASRAAWLDALRGLAVLGMIETHAVNTLLAPGWREGAGFERLVYVNGLVAPVFLWIAGYAHGLGARKRALGGGPVWRRTVRRLLGILVLAYLIHLPVPGTGATWRLFFGVDVLHCLAASLLAVVAVERRIPGKVDWVLAAVAAGTVWLGVLPPNQWERAISFWPLQAWVDQSGVSLFPVVPWAAFVFVGFLMARWRTRWWVWAVLGAALIAIPSPPFSWKSHPAFFVERLGWLLVGAAGARGMEERVRYPRWLCWVGQESLPFYLSHLAILYLVPGARWIGPRLDPAATAAAAVGLAAASAGMAWAWRRFSRWRDAQPMAGPRAKASS